MKTKSALSWFGSDSEVAADLAKMLDHCEHVSIPFCGGCAIIPHLKSGVILCADRHDAAINFYRVANGTYGESDQRKLFEMCANTLNHQGELDSAYTILNFDGAPMVHKAWAFWATCWLPRKGRSGTKQQGPKDKISVRYGPGGGDNASRITKVAEELPLWAKQLKRCSFDRKDFRGLIPKTHDKPNGGLYIDAPWVDAGDDYLHPFVPQDHRDLARLLHRFEQATVVIRYGDCELVRELYGPPGERWAWINAESRTQTNAVKGEVWITNKQKSIGR